VISPCDRLFKTVFTDRPNIHLKAIQM
jgi:hypothetical protein